ncbi:MAG TPA: glycosyltransferase family 2 protein [Thermoanaerobaculia bacterium]|nr:glycosyltransferase family 2 protein [Thermoanaerobaculia bacterium]
MIASLRQAARAVLGRPPSDWAGPDAARAAISGADPIEPDDRFDVVCFPGAPAQGSAALRRLDSDGHRVLFPAAEGLDFESLDRTRRDLGLGATISIVAGPPWRTLAERFRDERGWPATEAPPAGVEILPERLAAAFAPLSVVIVTWNNRAMNRLCLESVFARTEWPKLEVIVVDNGSSDGTPELLHDLAGRHPNLRVLALPENRGFPAACNAGLAMAGGEYLCLLNNDTVLTRGWAAALAAHLVRNPRLGLVGPVTNAIANEARIDVGYGNLGELPAWSRAWVREHDGEAFEIPMLAFFCVLMRRETFARVGPLDERFGTGMFEDGDYNRRVRAAGWDVLCARDAFVHHWQKASFRQLGKDAYFRLYEENRRKYEDKWGKR